MFILNPSLSGNYVVILPLCLTLTKIIEFSAFFFFITLGMLLCHCFKKFTSVHNWLLSPASERVYIYIYINNMVNNKNILIHIGLFAC